MLKYGIQAIVLVALIVFVIDPFGRWGAEEYGWKFLTATLPIIFFLSWLYDRRQEKSAQQESSQGPAQSHFD